MYLQESEQYEYHLNNEKSIDIGISSLVASNEKSGLEEIYSRKQPVVYVEDVRWKCHPHPLVYKPLNTIPW